MVDIPTADGTETVTITANAIDAPASGSGLLGFLLGWRALLLPASFRGVPFGILENGRRSGRRIALHEYPFRDDPWAEDIGRAAGRIAVTGFLLDNDQVIGTGPLSAARRAIEDACDQPDAGTFMHPARGPISVVCEELEILERWDEGLYLEIRFFFIETGERQFPAIGNALTGLLSDACDALDSAVGFDFTNQIGSALKFGSSVAGQIAQTTNQFVQFTRGIAGDATNLKGALTSLPGNFGRYFGAGTNGFVSKSLRNPLATVSGLEATAAAARFSVGSAASRLVSAGIAL